MEFRDRLDEMRCWPTDRLLAARDDAVREQRRWRVEELAATKVLDDRGALDAATAARDGVSPRTAEETVATAHALAELPEVAAAAAEGRLSNEQLAPVAQLADEATDAEWASRGGNIAPADLTKMVRNRRTPTVDEAKRRREARSLRWWWNQQSGMLAVRGELPDLDGATFETVMNEMVDRMKPGRDGRWETRERRAADALVELCATYGHDDRGHPGRLPTLLVVEVPMEGPAEVAGVPLPAAMVEKLRAAAKVEPHLVDGSGADVLTGRTSSALSLKVRRAVKLRDGHCRWPGCERRTGLEVHHLVPRSWGGTDDISNLAAVCTGGVTDHHARLVPYGDYILSGNPNQPDGLRLERRPPDPGRGARSKQRSPSRSSRAPTTGDLARAGPGP